MYIIIATSTVLSPIPLNITLPITHLPTNLYSIAYAPTTLILPITYMYILHLIYPLTTFHLLSNYSYSTYDLPFIYHLLLLITYPPTNLILTITYILYTLHLLLLYLSSTLPLLLFLQIIYLDVQSVSSLLSSLNFSHVLPQDTPDAPVTTMTS